MSSEGLHRRDLLKKALAAGAAMIMPKAAKSADKKESAQEQLEQLKNTVADIRGRYQRFMDIGSTSLKREVAKTIIPELKQDIRSAMERATAEAARAVGRMGGRTLADVAEVDTLYTELAKMEKDIDLTAQSMAQ